MPDNDQFACASRSAKAALKVSHVAPEEPTVEVDHAALAVWLEKLFSAFGGLPPLGGVLTALKALDEAPLFAGLQDTRDNVLDAIEAATDACEPSAIALVLRRAAIREVLLGRHDMESVLKRFCFDLIARYVLESKGGLIDRIPGHVFSRERERLEQDMLPVVELAAEQLSRAPALRRLRLATYFRKQSDVATVDLAMKGFSYGECA